MADLPRVQQLLDEILESGCTPDEICGDCPELLPEVRKRWRQMRALEAELDALFPTPGLAPEVDTSAPWRADGDLPSIPGYDVQDLLGRGGMGMVYKARHLRLNRMVALKMLIAGAYAGPHERERFQREAKAAASLRHPNIVQVYDVGEHERWPYFTMELVEGGSLAQALAGTPQPARHAAALLATLADAIQVAHPGRNGSPRSEAGQHPCHGRRHSQGCRFRTCATRRGRADPHPQRRQDRDSELHGPRAGDRQGGYGRARRGRLRARCYSLRNAHGKAAVSRRHGVGNGATGDRR